MPLEGLKVTVLKSPVIPKDGGHQNAHETFECWLVDTQKTQLIRRFSMIIEGSGPGL